LRFGGDLGGGGTRVTSPDAISDAVWNLAPRGNFSLSAGRGLTPVVLPIRGGGA